MIASAIGSPSAPARTADSGAAADRDPHRQRILHRAAGRRRAVERRAMAADQVTCSLAQRSSSSSFSAKSSS